MFDHVTNAGEGDSWGDVIAPIVQTSNLVVLDHIAIHRVVVPDRQGEASYGENEQVRCVDISQMRSPLHKINS